MFLSHPRARFAALLSLVAAAALPGSAAAVDVRYLAFGDSITAGFGFDEACVCEDPSCRQACGYPRRLKRLLATVGIDAGVINEGHGGEKTPEGLTRIDSLLGPGYDVLLLMEGTNDITIDIPPETTLFNLQEMARKAELRGLETVHATLIPRFPEAKNDSDNAINALVAAGIRDLAFTGARRLVDPFEVFSTTPDLFAEYYAGGEMDPVGHPNAKGFDLLAETFFNALTGVDDVPPVVGAVEPVNGAEGVGPLTAVRVRLYDFGVGLDAAASTLTVNDEPVAVTSTSGLNWQDLVYVPPSPHPPEVAVRVQSRDLELNAMDREATRFTVDDEGLGPCAENMTTLCVDRNVGDARFQLTLHWHTALNGGDEGEAQAVPLASIGLRRGGLFSFFNLENPEVLVKVLDGCSINGHFWVFVAPTTTLGYELTVVDTLAALEGAERSAYEYVVTNTDGFDAPPISDTAAFTTCEYE